MNEREQTALLPLARWQYLRFMDYANLLIGSLLFLFGASIASVVTFFICRAIAASGLSPVENARDIALATVRERDSTIAALSTTLVDLGKKLESATIAITTLSAEKGRLEGEQLSLDAIKTELDARNKRMEELNTSLLALETTKSKLSTLNAEIERSSADTIASMEARLKAELAEKDLHVQRRLDDAADYHRRELAARQQALTDQLAMAQANIADQKKLLDRAEAVLVEKFGAVSLTSLKSASDEFIKLMTSKLHTKEAEAEAEIASRRQAIDEIVKPLKESLDKLDERHREIEEKRLSAYDGITGQVEKLLKETGLLSNALSRPVVRGNWGEITLRTVADNAGLIEGQDYELQTSFNVDERRLRPDMIVRLPNKRAIIIDSKVPMDAYREAMEATNDVDRATHMERHCRAVREHIKSLASKNYASQVEGADFVLMFLPTEAMYHAAIQHDPELINYALQMNVIPANPVTLICSLKSVAYILDVERLNQSANEIKEIGGKLYDGIRVLSTHFAAMGTSLNSTVSHFNDAVGSLERNALSKARQLKEKGIPANKQLAEVSEVSGIATSVKHQELIRFSEGSKQLSTNTDREAPPPLRAELVGTDLPLLDIDFEPDSAYLDGHSL